MYRYYMTQRPPMPGALPTNGLENILTLDPQETVPQIGKGAYALLEYSRPLTGAEISAYELTDSTRPPVVVYKGYEIEYIPADAMHRVSLNHETLAFVETLEEAKEGIDEL